MQTEAFTVHRATPKDVKALGEMLDTVYRPKLRPGDGMPNEFPHLFNADNANNLYYVEDAGKPVSMVAVFPQSVVFQGISMDVASIGSVVTLPEYQGRKISSAILDKIVEDLTGAGVPLMLVSGDRGLYRRIHCVPVGNMFLAEFTEEHEKGLHGQTAGGEVYPLSGHSSGQVRVVDVPADARSSYAPELGPIYRSEAYRYRRTDEEMAILVNALWSKRDGVDQRLFVILDGDRVVGYTVAYQAVAAPENVDVFEWAGSRTAFVQSLASIREAFGAKRIRFHIHHADLTMQSIAQSLGLSMQSEMLQGTFRLLNVPAFFSVLEPVFVERYGQGAEVKQTGDAFAVNVGSHQIETEHLEELISFVFDHGPGKLGIEFVHTDDLNYI